MSPSRMRPPSASTRRAMQRATVDLPEPDSPTSPSVSPAMDREIDVFRGVRNTTLPAEQRRARAVRFPKRNGRQDGSADLPAAFFAAGPGSESRRSAIECTDGAAR